MPRSPMLCLVATGGSSPFSIFFCGCKQPKSIHIRYVTRVQRYKEKRKRQAFAAQNLRLPVMKPYDPCQSEHTPCGHKVYGRVSKFHLACVLSPLRTGLVDRRCLYLRFVGEGILLCQNTLSCFCSTMRMDTITLLCASPRGRSFMWMSSNRWLLSWA